MGNAIQLLPFHDIHMAHEDENLMLFSGGVVIVLNRRKQLGKVRTGCQRIEYRFDPGLRKYCVRGLKMHTPIGSKISFIRAIWYFGSNLQLLNVAAVLFDAFRPQTLDLQRLGARQRMPTPDP